MNVELYILYISIVKKGNFLLIRNISTGFEEFIDISSIISKCKWTDFINPILFNMAESTLMH